MEASVLVGLGGLAALITALAGAFVALSKRKPETASVFIRSAESLVVSQSTVLRETTEAYEAMLERVNALEERTNLQESHLSEAQEKVQTLQDELSAMHEELAALTQSRDQAREEYQIARDEVSRLRERVRILEERLREAGLPVPPIYEPSDEPESERS